MLPSRLPLVLLLGLAAVLVRADLVLQAPPDPVLAGEEFVLTLLVTNAGTEAVNVPVRATLPVVARADSRSLSVVFSAAAGTTGDSTPLPAGGFRRVSLRGRLPADFAGLVVLDATASDAGRVAVEITPATPTTLTAGSSAAATTTGATTEIAPTPPPRREFGIAPHEPIYFAVGGNGGTNARFQLSFKFRPIGPSDDRVAGRGFWEDVYASYTQTSLWDLHSLSKPFTDSSYKPALFYYRYDTGAVFLGGRLGVAAGLEHESNGKGPPDSRSINTLFARPTLRWGAADSWQLVASPKLFWYVDKSENPDITRFRGYGDFLSPPNIRPAGNSPPPSGPAPPAGAACNSTSRIRSPESTPTSPSDWSTATCTSSISTVGARACCTTTSAPPPSCASGSWPFVDPPRPWAGKMR